MNLNLVREITADQLKTNAPDVRPGETVRVDVKIKEGDKDRASFYKYYSDQIWGDAQNYDLCINSSKLGVAGTVETIMSYIKARGLREE